MPAPAAERTVIALAVGQANFVMARVCAGTRVTNKIDRGVELGLPDMVSALICQASSAWVFGLAGS
jgi:hypothetical protein